MNAATAARAIGRGLGVLPEFSGRIDLLPMADGGEGTVDAFLATGAAARERRVRGPLLAPVDASFALDGTLAVVEMASASGLQLLASAERDPLRATSYGTGELLRAALDAGAERVVVGVGGSASVDGGAGMLSALGVRFLDASGAELEPGGEALLRLARVDASGLDPRVRRTPLEGAYDVSNVLCGPEGAAFTYGPQKGASPEECALLDAALARFADVTAVASGVDLRAFAGTGAAGGLGFALLAYCGAVLRPGFDVVANALGLPGALRAARVCFTGEGRVDRQTLYGKTVAGVGRLGRAAGVPVIAFAGDIEPGCEAALFEAGVTALQPIVAGPMDLAAAMASAEQLLERAATRAGRLFESAR